MSDPKSERGWFRHKKVPPAPEFKVWVDPNSPEGVAASVAAGAGSGSMIDALGRPHEEVYNTEPEHPDSRFFYYDLRTGQVLEGPKGSWQHRLGPYKTPYEAREALEIARERNLAWDRQTMAWKK
ncbi:MAG: hypothetical protein LBB58_03050 [Cellulomonadaceae bacterium]|nr:hypothetical protein [Cellulomonadaceae bacterium]